jgi:flavin-dependent dehydrogenase
LAEYLIDAFVPYLPEALAAQTAATLRARVREAGALEMAPTVSLPAPPATAPGLVLVGDAAGCSHPITASGMTMGLLDAQALGREARRRARVIRRAAREPWLDERALRRYRTEHERYVPTRQALADAIYEAFRGEDPGARAIRRALFAYWHASPQNRRRSLALLACDERRPHVFLSEYLKAARHAVEASLAPKHATHFPVSDRLRSVQGAVELAGNKLGLVAQVALAQVRPAWL